MTYKDHEFWEQVSEAIHVQRGWTVKREPNTFDNANREIGARVTFTADGQEHVLLMTVTNTVQGTVHAILSN
jgi:hypothetical protein